MKRRQWQIRDKILRLNVRILCFESVFLFEVQERVFERVYFSKKRQSPSRRFGIVDARNGYTKDGLSDDD